MNKIILTGLVFLFVFSLNTLDVVALQPAITEPPGSTNQPVMVKEPEPNDDQVMKNLVEQGVAPELLINKNLMTEKLKSEYVKDQVARYFRTAMNNGNLAGNDADIIKKFVKYQIYNMTIPEERNKLRSNRLSITKTFIDSYNLSPAKELYMREVSLRCKELMDNHLILRIQAAMMMVELNSEKANPARNIAPTPYTGQIDILLEVLNDEKQHQAVKVQIVSGIERICTLGRIAAKSIPDSTDRYNLTVALLKELEKGQKYHFWYLKNIIRCLPETMVIYDSVTKKPIVTEVLIKCMRDKQLDKLVRAEAARSLGRIQLDSSHNIDVLVSEIIKFALEMATAYNQNLTDPTYRDVLWSIYLAFHAENPEEQKKQYGLLEQVSKVTLAGSKSPVENGYEQILVLANSIFNEYAPSAGKPAKPIQPDKLKAVTDWLKANPAQQKSIHASSDPLK